MKPLDHTIRLGMVGCCGREAYPEETVHFLPECAGELSPAVYCHLTRHAEAGNPDAEEGLTTSLCSNVWKRLGLCPSGKPINDGQKIPHATSLDRWICRLQEVA